MKHFALLSALALVGCCTDNPSQSSGEPAPRDTAAIEYSVPETSAKLGVDVTITECSPKSAAEQYAMLKVEVTPTFAAVASKTRYRLVGADLSSWWTSHDLLITKYDSGTIKTVNSTSANRVLPAITNVIKGLVSVFAIAGSGNRNGLNCSDEVRSALKAAKDLGVKVKAAQAGLTTASPASAVSMGAALTIYTNEIARIKTSAPLHFTLKPQEVVFDKSAGYVDWPITDFPEKSFKADSLEPKSFRLVYCLSEEVAGQPSCTVKSADGAKSISNPAAPTSCVGDPNCTKTIVLRQPKQGILTVVLEGEAYGDGQGKIALSKSFPVAQWGEFSVLSSSVGLAENQTVSFSLDEYGSKTTFGWKSDARAESVTGGVGSVLDSTATLAGKLDGQDLAREKAEIDELQTQQKLNQLRACKAIIEAGGYTCTN
jgi:hypothetical protein